MYRSFNKKILYKDSSQLKKKKHTSF